MKDLPTLADELSAAAYEVSKAWDADSSLIGDRLVRAIVDLDEAQENYTFVRRELQALARRENRSTARTPGEQQ